MIYYKNYILNYCLLVRKSLATLSFLFFVSLRKFYSTSRGAQAARTQVCSLLVSPGHLLNAKTEKEKERQRD